MQILVRDGIIESRSEASICGYVSIPLRKWAQNWPLT